MFTPNKVLSKSVMLGLVGFQVLAFLVLWIFSPFVFLPTPIETLKAFSQLWSEGLGTDLATSFYLNIEGIGYSLVVSLFLAYLSTIPFFEPIIKFLSKLRFLSLVGLTFFFILVAKSGHELKLDLLVFSISIFLVTSLLDVVSSIPKVQFDLARTLRMGPWETLWEVVILGQFDKVFDVLRQNAAMAWMLLTMVEGISRSEGGIGALLLNQNKHFHLAAVMAVQILILVVGLGQDYVIGVLKNIFCPYANLTMERK